MITSQKDNASLKTKFNVIKTSQITNFHCFSMGTDWEFFIEQKNKDGEWEEIDEYMISFDYNAGFGRNIFADSLIATLLKFRDADSVTITEEEYERGYVNCTKHQFRFGVPDVLYFINFDIFDEYEPFNLPFPERYTDPYFIDQRLSIARFIFSCQYLRKECPNVDMRIGICCN